MGIATLPAVLADAALRHPERRLLEFEGATWTYAAFAAQVRAAAGALHAWGLAPGDRVALYAENSPSYLVAYLATLWCGGVVVPVNARYRTTELRHMLRDAGTRLAVTDEGGAAVVAEVAADAPALQDTVVLDGHPEADAARWRRLAAADPLAHPVVADGDALALIAYTSGTTGRSKGAMLSHANLLANAIAVGRAWRWSARDRLLLTLPLFHIHGLAVGFHGTLVQGASLTLRRRFDAAEVVADLVGGGMTMFFGVPTMYARLAAQVGDATVPTPGLRLLVSGSAPLAPDTFERIERAFGHRILERYGMTETVMLTGNPFDGRRKAGTVGLPFDGVELRLADPATDAPVAAGATGEVQVRGRSVTRGYWNDPEATRATFSADGWFKTGDLGTRDADGYLTLTGRARDLIISGGLNVYPREVEDLIATLPGVLEVAVVGLPDADLGERVAAAIALRDGYRLDAGAVVDLCRRHLAGFKTPREVTFVAALPRNAMGKVLRHELRDALGGAFGGALGGAR
jgi:malonyl-CoA/methylmalonyl-CoA synthetase